MSSIPSGTPRPAVVHRVSRLVHWCAASIVVALVACAGEATGGGDVGGGRGGDGTGGGTDTAAVHANFITVSAGDGHTCALTALGSAWCWGDNALGQLGDSGTADAAVPRRVAGGITFRSITAGRGFTCGLDGTGVAWCWGRNDVGQLGTGAATTTLSRTPQRVAGSRSWLTLSAGTTHACGVASNGTAFCWGRGVDGELGNGAVVSSAVPVAVITSFSLGGAQAGDAFACALRSTGQALCWGTPGSGGNRLGSAGGATSTPRAVDGSTTYGALSLGATHACAIESGAPRVACWGDPALVGSASAGVVPARVTFDTDAASVDAGYTSSCLLTPAGRAWCWGSNASGQLGDGTPEARRATPVTVLTDVLFSEMSVGGDHACGITTTGPTLCWGGNAQGQLGNGAASSVAVRLPVAVR